MANVRAIVELGRRIRTEAKIRVRQPLLEAVVNFPGDHEILRPLLDLVAEELNVKQVLFAESAEQLGRWRAKPNFKVLGPRLGPRVKDVAALLERDDGTLAAALAHGEPVTLDTSGPDPIVLAPGDVDLVQETREGWGSPATAASRSPSSWSSRRSSGSKRSRARWCAWSRTPGRRRAWT